MAITVTQLVAFLAVVHSGSVTAAAEELEVTQPSVSAAVAALAGELGCELLERAGRGVQPTAAGREFAAYAGDVIGLLEDGRRAAREAAERAVRELRVAASATAAETFVPALLQRYGDAYPEIEPRLTVSSPQAVVDAVIDHERDVAIVGHVIHDERLHTSGIGRNQLVCITAPADTLGYRISRRGAHDSDTGSNRSHGLGVAELKDRVWLLRELGASTRLASEQFLAQRGLAPDTLTLGSNAAIKQAVVSGLGVALLSRRVVEDELAGGVLVEVPLRDGPAAQKWYLVHTAIGPLRPAVAGFIEFARSQPVGHA